MSIVEVEAKAPPRASPSAPHLQHTPFAVVLLFCVRGCGVLPLSLPGSLRFASVCAPLLLALRLFLALWLPSKEPEPKPTEHATAPALRLDQSQKVRPPGLHFLCRKAGAYALRPFGS